ncbi:Sexual differentiation process putative subtilase-type proteinase isp6 [Wickerhamiella sorbophila]|uniref:Sexual differentiation process putative subtilase-type proteinase isp6 n=1 Tax=Wickerhamiella sorbophila TaxID=45607 RepID=A0A2T0FFZ9_9ASCO|nr:Sexual differentiation process putative subtilase-type proteinase isp6 [Wickerhamiella sorbophila]PRT53923.1 Sexual differentiation process putative subtilase-type proteinase isp6 [Wickerhamiella sorbophila]
MYYNLLLLLSLVSAAPANNLFGRDLQRQRDAPWGLARLSHKDYVYDKTANNLYSDENSFVYESRTAATPTVYVLDTGVLVQHQELGGRARWGNNFVDSTLSDGNGHGTHIAGLVAGSTVGVARNAQIIAVKVLNEKRVGSISNFVKAIDWVLQDVRDNNRQNVIINYSAVGDPDDTRAAAINKATNAGLLVVVAAGNNGKQVCNYGPAGEASQNSGLISVMALNWTNTPASFSNWGSCGSVYAPGVDVYSIRPDSTTSYGYMSGTSNAAGYVSGLAAYLWSLYPQISRDDLKNMITTGNANKVLSNRPGTANEIVWNYMSA